MKKYVDVVYRLEPTPVVFRNSVQGHNLIKHAESMNRFDSKKKGSNSGRLDTQKSQNEINPVILELKVKNSASKSASRCFTVTKSKLIEKRYFSNLKQKVQFPEPENKNLIKNLYLNFDICSKQPDLALKKYPLRRTPSLKNILSTRRSNPKSFDMKDPIQFSPMRELKLI
jgi:hypothetical protein